MKSFSNSRLRLPVSAGDAIDNWTAPWRARVGGPWARVNGKGC